MRYNKFFFNEHVGKDIIHKHKALGEQLLRVTSSEHAETLHMSQYLTNEEYKTVPEEKEDPTVFGEAETELSEREVKTEEEIQPENEENLNV